MVVTLVGKSSKYGIKKKIPESVYHLLYDNSVSIYINYIVHPIFCLMWTSSGKIGVAQPTIHNKTVRQKQGFTSNKCLAKLVSIFPCKPLNKNPLVSIIPCKYTIIYMYIHIIC